MIKIRKSDERGHVNLGWLDSYYSFSFGNYYDPDNMGFSKLRVINEDWISGGGGFDSHPHSDMEIITYVLDGALEHKDSMGNSSVIRKNDLQIMTAGRGVLHSEYNHSDTDEVHLLQIWITPAELGLKPSYEQKRIDPVSIKGNLKLVASGSKEIIDNEPIRINQDVDLYIGSLEKGQSIKNTFDINRNIWLQLARGSMTINNQGIEAGDGVSISNETEIELSTSKSAEFLLFNMN